MIRVKGLSSVVKFAIRHRIQVKLSLHVSKVLPRKSDMKPTAVSKRVLHGKYGHGTVTEADRQYTVIDFDLHGRKKFITKIVSLESSDEPAPPRRRGGARKKKVLPAK
jgi:hypothetical protein